MLSGKRSGQWGTTPKHLLVDTMPELVEAIADAITEYCRGEVSVEKNPGDVVDQILVYSPYAESMNLLATLTITDVGVEIYLYINEHGESRGWVKEVSLANPNLIGEICAILRMANGGFRKRSM